MAIHTLDRRLFLDTSYAIAIGFGTDSKHQLANEFKNEVQRRSIKVITTHAVCMEIGNSFSKLAIRKNGVDIIDAIQNDPLITLLPIDPKIDETGWNLFRNRSDKKWGMVDYISFVVMKKLNLRQALTADIHFEQAGFTALLRD